MADASISTDPSLWSFVGPAAQIGVGLYGSLNGSGQAASGYNNAYGSAQTGLNTSGAALAPFQAGGTAAVGAYENLLGLGGQAPNFDAFTSSPGYQFEVNQGNQAINRAAAASGGAFSTTTLAQLGAYDQGLASTQYNNYLAQLYGLSQLGANAGVARGSQALTGAGLAGNAQVGAGVSRGVGAANASGVLATGLGKLPWQQIGNYFSSPNTSQANSAATGAVNDYSSNFSVPSIYGSDPSVTDNGSGVTTYFGDSSNPS
jgi:hypothetical protein